MSLRPCLELAKGALPDALVVGDAALVSLPEKISQVNGVHEGVVQQTFDDDVLQLPSELHRAFDSDR